MTDDGSGTVLVTKFFRLNERDMDVSCSCHLVQHQRNDRKQPPRDRFQFGLAPSNCDHARELRASAAQVFEHFASATATDGDQENIALVDHYVVQHQRDRVWTLLEVGEVYVVTQLRKGSFCCKTCMSQCSHADTIRSAQGIGRGHGTSEMDKLPWLECTDKAFHCPQTWSTYTPDKRRLVQAVNEDRTVETADCEVDYTRIISANLHYHTDSKREVLKGDTVKPCQCLTTEKIVSITVQALLYDQRGVWGVDLEHQASGTVCAQACRPD